MSFCKNCGTNLGESRFCPSCGMEVNGNANVPTNNFCATNTGGYNGYSQHYSELKLYSSRATALLVFGILSIVCCMGIGLVFEIIAIVISSKMPKAIEYGEQLTNPEEIAMLNSAKARHKTGATLASIALLITGILLFVLIMVLAIGAQIG